MQGFLVRRSLAAVGTLLAAIVIIAVVVNTGICSGIDGIKAQIRQGIEQEIIDKKLTFPSPEARLAYIDTRVGQELAKRGLEACAI